MYLYIVSMYVYIHVVCMYVCMRDVCVCIYTRTGIYAYTNARHWHVRICMHAYACTYTCVHMHIHTYMTRLEICNTFYMLMRIIMRVRICSYANEYIHMLIC